MTLYCDGSGWNGSVSRFCVVTSEGDIRLEVLEEEHTSNEMEWSAMLEALRMASPGDTICADSKLVVNQLLGTWQVKAENLMEFAEEGQRLLRQKNVRVKWVPREQNLAGMHLEGTFR